MSANVYHPSRGGVRGGRDQFNWDDVKTDKDRENYLGKSLDSSDDGTVFNSFLARVWQ